MGSEGAPAKVAEGVLRLGTPLINWYLVTDDEGVTVVDAGAPAYRPQLEPGLKALGRTLADVRAVILTHGDADHKGFAERLRAEDGIPVHVHSADEQLTRTGKGRKREGSLLPYLRRPATWRIIAALARGGRPLHVAEVEAFTEGTLDVPGSPRVIPAPGHTPGCVAFHFERQRALFTGDVLCTYNVLTGRRGPQIMPGALNTSSEQSLDSLSRIEDVDAEVILPGHGEPWHGDAAVAVAAARQAGPS
jgi:glyoxylase-like metal-dependent hydrolase (beta-lactamase superfamily II)